jgi:hypothetical protein
MCGALNPLQHCHLRLSNSHPGWAQFRPMAPVQHTRRSLEGQIPPKSRDQYGYSASLSPL